MIVEPTYTDSIIATFRVSVRIDAADYRARLRDIVPPPTDRELRDYVVNRLHSLNTGPLDVTTLSVLDVTPVDDDR